MVTGVWDIQGQSLARTIETPGARVVLCSMLARLAALRPVRAYMHSLEVWPLITKGSTSSVLMAVADGTRQWLEQREQSSSCQGGGAHELSDSVQPVLVSPLQVETARHPPFVWDSMRTARQVRPNSNPRPHSNPPATPPTPSHPHTTPSTPLQPTPPHPNPPSTMPTPPHAAPPSPPSPAHTTPHHTTPHHTTKAGEFCAPCPCPIPSCIPSVCGASVRGCLLSRSDDPKGCR